MPTKAATLLPVLAMCAALFVACTAPATAPPTKTLPTATLPPVSTATPEPTSTPAPNHTATPTPTPKPTYTPTPFPASAFSVEVIGYQEHGAMFELQYDGDRSDLDQMTLRLTAQQDGQPRDANQAFDVIDGRHLAEMTDAMYHLGTIQTTLYLEATDTEPTSLEIETELTQWYPFLLWPFGDGGTASLVSLPRAGHPEAYDFAPKSSQQYPDGTGHPVLLPSEGKIITLEYGPPGYEHIHNTFTYLTDVGFYYQSGHFMWTVNEGSSYAAGTVIGYLTDETGWPHTHTTLRIPPDWSRTYDEGRLKEIESFVDMMNPHIQLGGSPLECGFFICDTLPERIREAIRLGFFESHYNWSGGELLRLPDY